MPNQSCVAQWVMLKYDVKSKILYNYRLKMISLCIIDKIYSSGLCGLSHQYYRTRCIDKSAMEGVKTR